MAQDFQLFRAGLAVVSGGDGLVLRGQRWEDEGDKATVRGVIRGSDYTSIADMKAARDQVNGYGPDNTDEPVGPVTWTQDPSKDGFWRVQRTRVDAELTGRPLTTAEVKALAWPFTIELLRVPGWQAPLFEVVCSGAARSTGLAVTGIPWYGIPALVDNASATGARTTWTTDHGTVYEYEATAYDQAPQFTGTASTYYSGACRVETSQDSGSTYHTLVGRQNADVGTYWRLTNGIVRVNPIVGGGIRVGYYDGANGWETVDFHIGIGAAGVFSDPLDWSGSKATILENSAACGRVRFSYPGTSTRDGGAVDFVVRRGAPFLECRRSAVSAEKFAVYRTASEAATSITAGIEATSANASGNKFTLISPSTVTKTVVGASGIHLTSAASAFNVALSAITSTAPGGSGSITGTYFAAINHHQAIVSR